MKKIKWSIMALTIVASVSGAFATAPQHDCRTDQQYYWTGGGFMPTGVWAVNYLCDASSNTCTYTTDGFGHYFPCRTGDYRVLPAITNETTTKKKK